MIALLAGMAVVNFDSSTEYMDIGGTACSTRDVYTVVNSEDGATFTAFKWGVRFSLERKYS